MKTVSTNNGDKSIAEILDVLMWGSYEANRKAGMTHEQLVNLGVGNEAMKVKYEQLNPQS